MVTLRPTLVAQAVSLPVECSTRRAKTHLPALPPLLAGPLSCVSYQQNRRPLTKHSQVETIIFVFFIFPDLRAANTWYLVYIWPDVHATIFETSVQNEVTFCTPNLLISTRLPVSYAPLPRYLSRLLHQNRVVDLAIKLDEAEQRVRSAEAMVSSPPYPPPSPSNLRPPLWSWSTLGGDCCSLFI